MNTLILSELSRVLAALALVVLAAIISRWQAVNLERQMLTAVVRAFVQLIAIGFALDLIFATDHPAAILLIIAVMIVIAGHTSGSRAAGVPNGRRVAFTAIGIGAAATLGLLIGLSIFQFTAQETIPIAGMVIGNSMNVCTLVMRRIQDEVEARQAEIEAALALGATGRQAVAPYLKTALQSGMTPIIDSTKTVGLIQLPGAMTGMILAGASPLEAVQLQIIVMYMLIGAAAFTGLAAIWFTHRQFLTSAHQLRVM
ncbi:MAG: iron export ABC transporter permease subunit FetB [Anaerolineales bacterium]|nr:iron export ABC transporter permease subunit FetB [Anaerolineales bacterium]